MSAMANVPHNRVYIGNDEQTFVPWLNKKVYRGTVELGSICIQ
jgi:hypothetical protein